MTIEDVTAWVVTADGRNARIFEERRRHAELHELEALAMRLGREDEPKAKHPSGTVHESGGPGRHSAHEVSPSEEAERRFLKRLAAELEQAAQAGRYGALVLMAPPRALGALRESLGPAARRLVTHEEPRDRLGESGRDLRLRLRDLRIPA